MVIILRVEELPRYFFFFFFLKYEEKGKGNSTVMLLKIIYIIPLNLCIYHNTTGLHIIINLKNYKKY